jgi:GTP-binding protein
LRIEASFVRSAAGAADLPRDGLAEIALVGRSNVGKSSLINALVRQRLARTSAAPGKTRLANIYRVARGGRESLYLVDLPGYGYARGDRGELEGVAAAYFDQQTLARRNRHEGPGGQEERDRREGKTHAAVPARAARRSALLVVDARHPGLENDLAAWNWLAENVATRAIAATKIDKLSREERLRAMQTIEAVFEHPATAVSAETGEGLDELWKLIDRLTNKTTR